MDSKKPETDELQEEKPEVNPDKERHAAGRYQLKRDRDKAHVKDRDQVMFNLPLPRRIHEELKRFAIRSNIPMSRLLIEAFLDMIHPNRAVELREALGPLDKAVKARFAKDRAQISSARNRCELCMRAHANMPTFGPWHDEKCPKYRRRPTVMLEQEEG